LQQFQYRITGIIASSEWRKETGQRGQNHEFEFLGGDCQDTYLGNKLDLDMIDI